MNLRMGICISTAQVLEMHEREKLSHVFFSLTMGPSLEVRCYSGCIIGGVRFHTIEGDFQCTRQNSGVMVVSENSGSNNNFYDVLDELLFVQYLLGRRVWLLKCRWFDTTTTKVIGHR